MHCDWCSLLNGICHTIKTNAGRGTDAARVIGVASRDFERAEAYMRFAMASRHNEDDDAFLRDADAYCDEAFGSLDESLRVFSRFALRLERVELVWCPFKRCAEDYYRNTDERYAKAPSPQAEEALYRRLGAMLGDDGTGIARLVEWGESNEQAVVASLPRQLPVGEGPGGSTLPQGCDSPRATGVPDGLQLHEGGRAGGSDRRGQVSRAALGDDACGGG